MRVALALGTSVAFTLMAALASAHIDMTSPQPRSHSALKEAPCGPPGNTRSANPTWFTPGEEVTIHWDETIDHPSHYRIMLDMDGSDFSDPSSFTDTCDNTVDSDPICVVDDLPDSNGGSHEYKFNLPMTECDNCSIQLIQVMTDKPPYGDGNDIYHACADIVISSSPNPTTAASSTHAAANNAAASSGTGTSTSGGGGAGADDSGGGCSVGLGEGDSSVLAIVGLAALAAVGWRRRR